MKSKGVLLLALVALLFFQSEGEERYFSGGGRRTSVFGNLVADALRDSGKGEVAFVSSDILTGDFIPLPNPGEVEKQLRTGETLYRVKLVGMEIQDIIKHNVENYQTHTTILYFSGMVVELGEGLNGAAKITIGKEPLMPHRLYKVIINKSLLNGVGGFRWFGKRSYDENALEINATASDAVLDYLKQSPTMSSDSDRLKDPHNELR